MQTTTQPAATATWLGPDATDCVGRCRACRRVALLGTARVSAVIDGSRDEWTERVCSAACAATFAAG